VQFIKCVVVYTIRPTYTVCSYSVFISRLGHPNAWLQIIRGPFFSFPSNLQSQKYLYFVYAIIYPFAVDMFYLKNVKITCETKHTIACFECYLNIYSSCVKREMRIGCWWESQKERDY
jgi:hypothetical protein